MERPGLSGSGLNSKLVTGPRRTKKRPSYGVRTVELTRGQFGYGFTLSGQGPCILSNIVADSPAAKAMLRSGDHVIAVNGRNVSKCGHDEVVRLIGNSIGLLKLQIAESYCSNSSSDEEPRGSEKTTNVLVHHHFHPPQQKHDQPREEVLEARGFVSDDEEYTLSAAALLPPRPFHMRGNSADSTLTESSVLHSYQRPKRPSPRKKANKQAKSTSTSKSTSNLRRVELHGSDELQLSEQNFEAFAHPTLQELRRSVKQQNTALVEADVTSSIFKSVVGYLGTIEMPPKDGVNDLTAIRNCIRRLRVEKKVHTMVLMCILPEKIVLINHHGLKLAEYPSDRVTFCGMYLDDKRFFGLVTSQVDDDEVVAGSCHVFMTEPVNDREEVMRRAKAFQFEPTMSTIGPGEFLEFPSDARPIIRTIMSVFGKDQDDENRQGDNENAGSNASSSEIRSGTTSPTNSDSGIGYREDPDQILLMEPQSPPPLQDEHTIEIKDNEVNEEKERFDALAMPPPKDVDGAVGGECADESFNSEQLDIQHNPDSLRSSMHKYLQSKQDHLKKSSQQLLSENRQEQLVKQSQNFLKPRLVTPTSSSASSTRDGLRPHVFDGRASFVRGASERSSVRSLDGIRFENPTDFSTPFKSADFLIGGHVSAAPSSSLLDSASPNLARFLYSSDTNLSQLADTHLPREQPAPSLVPGRGILRPCDQYPSEPGVLNSRPVSVQSSYGGHGSTTSRNDDEDEEEPKGSESRGWSRGSSLRKHLRRRSFSSSRLDQVGQDKKCGTGIDDVTITDEVDPEVSSQTGSERGIDIGRVASWATDFEKLLADPAGLRTFAEFLKKEFSHENIYFWTACERYRRLTNETSFDKRRKLAADIVRRHLASGCPEPVNVDSHARQAAIEGLDSAPNTLFSTAQKQIYNLMKFDSFSRFLKSDLYKDSLMADMSGKSLKFDPACVEADPDLDIGVSYPEQKFSLTRKQKKDFEASTTNDTNRRRSLLPSWNHLRGGSGSRSKSKDRAEVKKSKEDSRKLTLPDPESLSSSHNTSNDSEDSGCKLARVILPDKATTVIQTRSGESIRAMVARLLEKRGLKFTSFDVFATDNAEKPLDLAEDSLSLACTEVRVEPRVLFRLELPSKKSIGVKAKPAKLVKDVLGPILSQYGWNLELMNVRKEGDPSHQSTSVDMLSTVSSIDNCRLTVSPRTSTEINSRVLEDLLRVKSTVDKMSNIDDDGKSESSNGSASNRRFFRQSISNNLKQPKQTAEMEEKMAMPPPGKIPQGRRLPQPPSKNPPTNQMQKFANAISEDLYEGLKLVQRGRLEDQRGTEINFEMPDFLKRGGINKENCGPQFGVGLPSRQSEPVFRRDVFPPSPYGRHSMQGAFDYSMARPSHDFSRHNESNFSNEGFLPSLQEADRFFGSHGGDELGSLAMDSRLSFGMRQYPQPQQQLTSGQYQDPIYETLSTHGRHNDRRWNISSNMSTVSAPSLTSTFAQGRPRRGDPPPLPPKPRLMKPDSMFVGSNSQLESLSSTELGLTTTDDRGYSVSFV